MEWVGLDYGGQLLPALGIIDDLRQFIRVTTQELMNLLLELRGYAKLVAKMTSLRYVTPPGKFSSQLAVRWSLSAVQM
jgi:hypothetical protein